MAEKLAGRINTLEALDTRQNTDGTVSFTELVSGLYLVLQTTDSWNGYTFTPFLVSMPDEDGNYELKGKPKPGILSPTPTPSPSKQTTEATVCKVWNDEDNKDGKRPAELKVTLSNGQSVTLNEANKWQATIRNLPKKDSKNKEIQYEWTEGEMPEGYTMTLMKINGTVTTITNTYKAKEENPPDDPPKETKELTVKKVWSDTDNKEKKRPEELKVKLSDGQEVTLNEANNWTATLKDLPVKDSDGKEISYSWKEGDMPEGYKLTEMKVDDNVTTLTNTYETKEETPPKNDETTPNNPTNNTTPNTPSNKSVPSEKLPQTGQLWWPVPLMSVMGLILLTAGVKRRKSTGLRNRDHSIHMLQKERSA